MPDRPGTRQPGPMSSNEIPVNDLILGSARRYRPPRARSSQLERERTGAERNPPSGGDNDDDAVTNDWRKAEFHGDDRRDFAGSDRRHDRNLRRRARWRGDGQGRTAMDQGAAGAADGYHGPQAGSGQGCHYGNQRVAERNGRLPSSLAKPGQSEPGRLLRWRLSCSCPAISRGRSGYHVFTGIQ